MAVSPVPAGFHTVTPYLLVDDCRKLLDYLSAAFGGEELMCHKTPDGRVMHAQIKIGDSIVMMGEAMEQYPAMPVMLYLYVPNVDELYQQALASGGKSVQEPTDQFYGDRSGAVEDPCGNKWWISTHVEDVSDEEMARRMKEAC